MEGVRDREFIIRTGDAAAFSGQARGLSLPETLSLGLRRGGCRPDSAQVPHSLWLSVPSTRSAVVQMPKPSSSLLPDQADWADRLVAFPKKAFGGGLRK